MNPPNCQKDRCILVFLKVPQKSVVKTRLAKVLGQGAAAGLYQNFVFDLLDTLNSGCFRFTICFHPPQARSEVADWLGHPYPVLPQQGNNLGERMANAFKQAFSQGFRHVLLVGTDFPDLPAAILDQAFNNLPENNGVIGPSTDGGYYLIGFNRNTFLPAVFDEMPWGTETVFEKTLKVFNSNRHKIHVLPKWRDIDTFEDLEFFIKTYSPKKSRASKTAAYLKSIGFDLKSA